MIACRATLSATSERADGFQMHTGLAGDCTCRDSIIYMLVYGRYGRYGRYFVSLPSVAAAVCDEQRAKATKSENQMASTQPR